jgi:hypothetical protein
MPFAVVGANVTRSVAGKAVRGRDTRAGFVDSKCTVREAHAHYCTLTHYCTRTRTYTIAHVHLHTIHTHTHTLLHTHTHTHTIAHTHAHLHTMHTHTHTLTQSRTRATVTLQPCAILSSGTNKTRAQLTPSIQKSIHNSHAHTQIIHMYSYCSNFNCFSHGHVCVCVCVCVCVQDEHAGPARGDVAHSLRDVPPSQPRGRRRVAHVTT